jgi:membrane-associated phospholipid phosphatase
MNPLRKNHTLRRILIFLQPDLIILLIFTTLLSALGFIYGHHLHLVEGSVFYALGSFLAIELIYLLYRAPKFLKGHPGERKIVWLNSLAIARDWVPFVVLIGVYETLRDYTALIRPDSIDHILYRIDQAIFGIEPSVWIQRFAHPFLTDYLAIFYTLYLALPLTFLLWTSLKDRRDDFRELSMSITIVLYVGFILYCIFPAGPPRHFAPLLSQFDPAQLPSLGFFHWSQRQMDSMTSVPTRSSFPSLHCALSCLALLYSIRFGNLWSRHPRALVWVYLVPVVSLWTATVYLRHHWIPDIVAGILLAICTYFLSPRIRKKFKEYQKDN